MRPCKSSSQLHRALAKAGATFGSIALVATMYSTLPAAAVTSPVPAPATFAPATLSPASSAPEASTQATAVPAASAAESGASGAQPVPVPPIGPAPATPARQAPAQPPVTAVPLPPTPTSADLDKLKPKDSGHEMGRAGKAAPAATSGPASSGSAAPGPAILPSVATGGSGLAASQQMSVQLAMATPVAASGAAPAMAPAIAPMAIQPNGTAGLPLGMDVSGWQQNVDWQTAWNNGARFAYIKASEGPWTLNDYFAQQYNGSASVGMLRGAYAFARPNLSSGANQANVLVQSGGGWSADGQTLPGVLDLETNSSDKSGACFGMSPAQLTSWTADFTQTYKNLTGRDAVIYTAYHFWQGCLGGTSQFSQSNPLWIAAYGAPANDVWMPGDWPQFTFWQYSNGVDGLGGSFPGDQNLFNGSYAQLQTLALGSRPAPPSADGKDYNGDRYADVLALDNSGAIWLYPGNGWGGLLPRVQVGWGWDAMTAIVSTGDFNGDGRSDVLARDRNGTLWLYAGNGAGGWLTPRQVGWGWNSMTAIVGARDFNGDGKADILARDGSGALWLYAGNGAGGWLTPRQVGSGWNAMTAIVGVGDFNGDGKADVLARDGGGTLWLYPGNGAGGWLPRVQVGWGWNSMTAIVAPGDFNGDGHADVLARDAGGTLWLYPGNGAGGWLTPSPVGAGWNVMNALP